MVARDHCATPTSTRNWPGRAAAASFFLTAPVMLNLRDMAGFTTEDFAKARDTSRRDMLAFIVVQNALPAQVAAAAAAELSSFAPNSAGRSLAKRAS